MRYFLIVFLILTACSSKSLKPREYNFNYKVTNQRTSGIIQVFDNGEKTYFKLAPGFKGESLVTDSGTFAFEGEGSLKNCECLFKRASFGVSEIVRKAPEKKRAVF